MTPSIAWSQFARDRHTPDSGRAWYDGTEDGLLDVVRSRWSERRPGAGRTGLDQVVVVPVPPAGFRGATVLVDEGTPLQARLERRQPQEDPFIRVTASGPVTMARNFLQKPGGTFAPYPAEQFAESIWCWSRRARLG